MITCAHHDVRADHHVVADDDAAAFVRDQARVAVGAEAAADRNVRVVARSQDDAAGERDLVADLDVARAADFDVAAY